jgi:hypothetical protein
MNDHFYKDSLKTTASKKPNESLKLDRDGIPAFAANIQDPDLKRSVLKKVESLDKRNFQEIQEYEHLMEQLEKVQDYVKLFNQKVST